MPRLIEMAGPPRERGRAYGEQARDLIAEAVDRWPHAVGSTANEVLDELVDRTGFRTTSGQLAPELVEEVEGIAEGAGADMRRVWALNLLDESWWMARALGGGCSCFALPAAPGRPALVAQNMDLPPWTAGLQVLLHIRPDDGTPQVLAPSVAGLVATHALNDRAVAVAVNALTTLPHHRNGLPVAFLIRLAAAQASGEAAVALLEAVPHASGQNYLIADRRGATDLECGHGFVRTLDGTDGRLAHTNHVLGKGAPGEPGVVADSEERLAALLDRIGDGTGIGVTAAAAILRAPPTYRNERGEATTFSSTIADLSDPPVLHVADGPPGNEFTAHSVTR